MSGWNNDGDSLLDSGLDDEGDFVEGMYDNEEDESPELEASGGRGGGQPEMTVARNSLDHVAERARLRPLRMPPSPRSRQGGKHRMRAMSDRMMKTFPDVQSMLITRTDGNQILFVRKER